MTGLLHVPFFEDELLTSYLSRTARANGRGSLRGFCSDVGIGLDSVIHGDDEPMDRLAELLPYAKDELLTRRIAKPARRRLTLGGIAFTHRALAPAAVKFCPSCLAEDSLDRRRMAGTGRYARRHWALSCIRACERHDRLLVPFGVSRDDTGLHDFCVVLDIEAERLAAAASCSPSCTRSDFESFVLDRLAGTGGHGELLDRLPLAECIDLCECFGIASSLGKHADPRNVDAATLRSASCDGLNVLRAGETGIRSVLDRLSQSVNKRRPGGRALYGRLYDALKRNAGTCDLVVSVVNSHALERLPALSGTSLLGQPQGERWTTIGEIALTAKMSPEAVARYLLQHGHLDETPIRPRNAKVDPATGRAASNALRDAVTFSEASSLLGCSAIELTSLVRAGLVKPVLGRPALQGRSLLDRYSRSQLTKINAVVVGGAVSSPEGLIPFRQAIGQLGRCPAEAFALLLDGRLKRVACLPGLPTFKGLLVDPEEMQKELCGTTDAT
jgi:hypothetical protein